MNSTKTIIIDKLAEQRNVLVAAIDHASATGADAQTITALGEALAICQELIEDLMGVVEKDVDKR